MRTRNPDKGLKARATSAAWLRVDKDTGEISDVAFNTVFDRVSSCYKDAWLNIADALKGDEINTPFAYYRIKP